MNKAYVHPAQWKYIQEISGNKENFKIKDRIQDGFREHVQKAQTTITGWCCVPELCLKGYGRQRPPHLCCYGFCLPRQCLQRWRQPCWMHSGYIHNGWCLEAWASPPPGVWRALQSGGGLWTRMGIHQIRMWDPLQPGRRPGSGRQMSWRLPPSCAECNGPWHGAEFLPDTKHTKTCI